MSNGAAYVDLPPLPNTKIVATSFPFAAPIANRSAALFVSDMEGAVSLSHNATNTPPPSFLLLVWSDVCGYWINQVPQICQANAQIMWKMFPNCLIYIYSSVALTGASSIVAVGGLTIQGNQSVLTTGA